MKLVGEYRELLIFQSDCFRIFKFPYLKKIKIGNDKHWLYKHSLGDEIKVFIKRDGKEKELTLKLTHKIGD